MIKKESNMQIQTHSKFWSKPPEIEQYWPEDCNIVEQSM